MICVVKDCEAVSFRTDDSCSLQVSGSVNAGLNVQITLTGVIIRCREEPSDHNIDRTRQRLRNETDESLSFRNRITGV